MSNKRNFSACLKKMNPDYTEAFGSNARDSVAGLFRRIEELKKQHPDMEFYYLSYRGILAGYYSKRIEELKKELQKTVIHWPNPAVAY